MPMLCDVLVVLDPVFCNIDFLSSAIRDGCHLFLSDKLKLNSGERVQLIHLAKEGGSYIQIQNDFLFQPFHKKIITRTNGTCFIEVRQSVDSMQESLQDVLLNNLLLILKAAGAHVHRVDVFCGTAPSKHPDILYVHINFTNASKASLTITLTGDRRIHRLNIYYNGEVNSFDFIQNSMNEYPAGPDKSTPSAPSSSLLPDQISGFIKKIEAQSDPVYSLSDEIEVFHLMEKIREKLMMHSVTL